MYVLKVLGFLLFSVFFYLVILSLWLRMALHYFRISSLNPVYHLIHTLTDPLVHPFKALFKQKRYLKYDWPCFTVLVLVEILKIILLSFIFFHAILPMTYLVLYVLADLIIQPLDILFYALLIRVILSFANPHLKSPLINFLYLLTEPLLNLGRKLVPIISGFDFSPFIMMLILKILSLAITNSLPWRIL